MAPGALASSSADFSVVMPVRGSETSAVLAVESLRHLAPESEILVVQSDGTLDGETRQALLGLGVRLLEASETGRGAALEAGAREACRRILLFLHVDTRLPENVTNQILEHLKDPEVVGGWFFRWLDEVGVAYRLADLGANGFSLVSGIATGDQALFCRRSCWPQVGPLTDFPLFEDMTMIQRLRKLGRVPPVWSFVGASPRRFHRLGVIGTVARNLALSWRFYRGGDPRQLFQEYYRT
jgi:hypothetical protein